LRFEPDLFLGPGFLDPRLHVFVDVRRFLELHSLTDHRIEATGFPEAPQFGLQKNGRGAEVLMSSGQTISIGAFISAL
jgi:hypothetical protein